MKLSALMLIFAVAVICLFSLQASWLYNTYQLHLRNIEGSINSIFSQSIEKELDQRFSELLEKSKVHSLDSTVGNTTFKYEYGSIENKGVISQQLDIVQQITKTYNILFNINNLDSIFHSLLQSNHYPVRYQISHVDSTNRVINTAGQEIKKGFKTQVMPIINGEKAYAVVKITSPVVFRNMLAILIVSVLIFLFIIACLIYEVKIFLNQHHINRLRENFTHALTHDMKTPLSTIHSILVQLESEALNKNPELKKKFTAIAIEQTLNLQATVNQILTLAYIEKKQLLLNKQNVNLPTMIQSLIDKFTIKPKKEIVFQTSFDSDNCMVFADSFYLENAVSNLIDNAIKYSGDSVQIEINCATTEKHTHIHVKDNGFGISANDQLNIFKQFERGAEIKRNQISGFGIGLNYVQRVIEAHGGTVAVVSQEGSGSEFIIALPHQ